MKRLDLLQAIKLAMPGVDKGASVLGTNFLVFDENWIRSFNDTMGISSAIETGVQCAVKAEELYKILGKMSGDSIQVFIDGPHLVVKDQKTKLKMTAMEESQFQQLIEAMSGLETDNLTYTDLPSDFIDGLKLCMFGTSNNPIIGILSGIAVNGSDVFASDSFRASHYIMESPLDEFTISMEIVSQLIRHDAKFTHISVTETWVHLLDENGSIVSCRKFAGKYPTETVTEIFSSQFPDKAKETYELPKGLEEAIDRAEVLSSATGEEFEYFPQIILSRKSDHLIIHSQRDVGEIEDKILWKEKAMPEGIELKVSPPYLRRVLSVTRSFRMSHTKRSILFEAPKFKHLMVAIVG